MPSADTTAKKPTTTPPELNSGAAALLIALERLLPDGALEDVAAAIARFADRETERRAEDAASRAAMEGELMELRAALPEALARADEAERRADALDAEAARLRDALSQIARVSTDALGAPTTVAALSERTGMDGADAAGRDVSAAPAAAQVTAPSRSRLGPEEIAAYFRKRDLMLECVMEARMASSTGGSARSPKNGDAAGTSASPG